MWFKDGLWIIMSNFVAKAWTVTDKWRYFSFQIFKITAIYHVGFSLGLYRPIQQCVYETMIYDISDVQKLWNKLGLILDRTLFTPRLTSGVIAWDHVCVLMAEKIWTRALKWMFICMIHQNILWNSHCNLMHVTAILWLRLNVEVVFTCIFGV